MGKIVGTHNSMTYLPVKQWYLRPFKLFAKCQSKGLFDQIHKYNSRIIDLRLYFDYDCYRWCFAHGYINFKNASIIPVLTYIDESRKSLNDGSEWYVRILLEKVKDDIEKEWFVDLCSSLEKTYPNIKFYGGNYKPDWTKLYTFKNDINDVLNNQWVSSMQSNARWYEKLVPKFYAKRMNKTNKDNIAEITNIFDFIEYG